MYKIYQTLKTPWKITNEFKRFLIYPRVRFLFALNGIRWDHGWRLYGVPVIQKHHKSEMIFESGLSLRSSIRSNPIGPFHPVMLSTIKEGASLRIGKNFRMTGGSVCAAKRIYIGNNVVVGANTTIIDTDFHPLYPEQRKNNPSDGNPSPVIIEDDVFIGMNCSVLKGRTLGTGCLIGACSVVTKDIPPYVIAAGNPARILRELSYK